MSRSRQLFLVFGIFLLVTQGFAAKRYWVATTGSKWNTTANWSTTSGGGGGASVPGSSDTVYFNGGGTGNDTFDVNVSVKRMEIASGYTGTIVQGAQTLTIGTSGAVLSGGTFSGGSASITVSGAFTISGCAFTSTSGTFSTSANFTVSSGSFTHNSGKLSFTATSSFTISNTGGTTFYDLDFSPTTAAATITVTSTTAITVSHLLSYGGTKVVTLNSGTINVAGNINTSGNTQVGDGGTTLININGSTGQSITGNSTVGCGRLPKVTINKSADSLKLYGTISVTSNWTYTAGVLVPGTSTVNFAAGTISGTFSLYNVWFTGGNTFTISNTITVNNDLVPSTGGQNAILNTGTINVKGNLDYSGSTSAVNGGGTATIVFNGSGTQYFKGSTTTSAARVCNISISKSASDSLILSNNITVLGTSWSCSSGFVYAKSNSTVVMVSSTTALSIGGSQTFNNLSFYGGATRTYTLGSGITLTVTGTLTISGASQVTINNGTLDVKGDFNFSNSVTSGTGGSVNYIFDGTGNQSFSGSTTALAARIGGSVQINKPSGTLTLFNNIMVYGNWTYTSGTVDPGTSTITFISTKTITGSHTLYNVRFEDGFTYTITPSTTLTVNGTLTFSGTLPITLTTGTIEAKGNIQASNASSGSGGSTTIVINGTVDQTLTGYGTAGQGSLPKIVVDKTSGTLFLASVISVAKDWTYTKGEVKPQTSTVAFYGTLNLDGQESGTTNTMAFNNVIIASGTTTLTGNLDCDGNLSISSGATLSAGSNTVHVGGNWDSQGTWTYSTSNVIFDGSGYRTISGASGAAVNFYDLGFNKTSQSLSFLKPVKVNHAMTLTKGHIKTTSTNYLEFADDATNTGGGISAYVHGPIRKTGNDAFVFPLGDTTLTDSSAYHPLGMTAPSSTSDQFEATYFAHAQTVGDSLVDTLASVSTVEYWTLKRNAGSSDVYTTLYWNSNSTNVDDVNALRVGAWDGAKWIDRGASGLTISDRTGYFSATSYAPYTSSIAYLAIANSFSAKSYAVLHRKLDGSYYQVNNGALYFMYDEEYNDVDNHLSFKIYNQQHETIVSSTGAYAVTLSSDYGDNRFYINLLSCSVSSTGYLHSGTYILEVTNEKNETWYLRFKNNVTFVPTCSGSGGGM